MGLPLTLLKAKTWGPPDWWLCTQELVIHFISIQTSLLNCLFGTLGLSPGKWEPEVKGEEGEGKQRQVHIRHAGLRKEFREQNWDNEALQTLHVQALLESVLEA